MEGYSWKLLSAEDRFKRPVLAGLRTDPVFLAYRSKIFAGHSSVEDAISAKMGHGSGAPVAAASSGGGGGNGGATLDILQELKAWGNFWDVGSGNYPVTRDKVCAKAHFSVCSACCDRECDTTRE